MRNLRDARLHVAGTGNRILRPPTSRGRAAAHRAVAITMTAFFVYGLLGACAARLTAGTHAATARESDTLCGTLILEGSEPTIPVMLTSRGRIVLDSSPPEMLRLSRAKLWVRGIPSSQHRFRPVAFLVRGVNGSRAWDGVIVRTPLGFALTFGDGSRRELHAAPPAFESLVGKRVWVTETGSGTVADYGVI
jgi:hypothetical protein